MLYVSTTELRTKTSELVKTLKQKGKITLVHRSQIIGVIEPAENEPKKFNAEKAKKAIEKLHLPKTTPEQREKHYRSGLEEKYGKNISGR